jgi:hypothetical protein
LHTGQTGQNKHIAGNSFHISPTGYTAQIANFTLFCHQTYHIIWGIYGRFLIQNGRLFITHSTTISNFFQTNALSLQNSKIFLQIHTTELIQAKILLIWTTNNSCFWKFIGLTLKFAKNVILEIYLRSRLRL